MKKIISILLTSALMMSICACDTDTQTEETTSQNTVYTVAVPVETTMETEPVETTIVEIPVYSLEGMTADEIMNELISFALITDTDTIVDYPNRFAVEPVEVLNGNFFYFYSSDYGTNNYQDITDCIIRMCVDAQIEMDNSITYTDNGRIQVELRLTDCDIATALYDSAYNFIIDNGRDDQNGYAYDNREGTYWESFENGCHLTMEKDGDNYELLIQLPVIQG